MPKLNYGLIGHPVGHSFSPAMHNAAFIELKIDAEYKLFDILPENLETFLEELPKNGISGVNITIPHKIKAKEYLEKFGTVNEHALRLGAVNTIKVDGVNLSGFNTDGPGFYRSLVEDLKFEPEGKTVFVLGAGGTARAIIMYLGNGPKKIYVTDIDERAPDELKKHFEKYYDRNKLEVMKIGDLKKGLEGADLLVQATPIGMKDGDPSPVDADFLHSKLRVYDVIYNRPVTKLIQEAKKRKLHATTGSGMLLYQGAIAFELWTGKKAPVDVMRKALREALRSNQFRSGSDN